MTRSIPWPRIFAEGVAIVVSILLAFGIQAWWEARQERAEEIEVLASLRDELIENQRRLDVAMAFTDAMQTAANTVMEIAASPGVGIPPDSVDVLLGTLSWWGGTDWVTASVEALVSGGDLDLIEDATLRADLSAWTRRVEQVMAIEAHEVFTFQERWVPYLMREGYLAQLANSTRMRPGSTELWPGFHEMPLAAPRADHRELLSRREFQNLVQVRLWDFTDLHANYEIFAADLTELLGKVERSWPDDPLHPLAAHPR